METGFLNPIQDEEHFSAPFYDQDNCLEDNDEVMLFNEMIVPEIIDYDNLWHAVDDEILPTSQPAENGPQKEDFQKMLFEWQHQLTSMQEPEVINKIIPVAEKTPQEISEIFAEPTTEISSDPFIDELFPPENIRDPLSVQMEESSNHQLEKEVIETTSPAKSTKVPSLKSTSPVKLEVASPSILYEKIDIKLERDDSNPASSETCTIPVREEGLKLPLIKFKLEREEPCEEVEPVSSGQEPLLLAGDLNSLLEQFEATEQVNVMTPSPPRPTSQTIRDSLPAEVISRIKASREKHKKIIPVIPAMPNKRPGKGATRMQDAGATLSRNKLLKLVTGGAGGETVQLDHAYCNSGGGDSASSSSRSFYVSDSSEYPSQSSTPDTSYSRVSDYFHPQKRQVLDTSSRKDSGLESGENSDEELLSVKCVTKTKVVSIVEESATAKQNKVPVVSLLLKNIKVENVEEKDVNSSAISDVRECLSPATSVGQDDLETGKKKKKLNLEEYRVRREERERIRSQESSRANSPVSCASSTAPADSTTTNTALSEGAKDKPLMLSVEVQTQTCDFIDLTASKSSKESGRSRVDRKEKRNDLDHRSYRSRRGRSYSSSSDSDHHHRRKRNSRRRSKHRKSSVSRMWSRSRSRSSQSLSSSRSRSGSRSRDRRDKYRSRSPRRSSNHRHSNSRNNVRRRDSYRSNASRDRSSYRSRSPIRINRNPEFGTQEKNRQVEERRVIYVGRIDEGTTKADLRRRFQQFGPIVDISLHFRERADNYGFVTFSFKADAYKAVEHGNDDPKQPRYDLCFGGRRAFCKQRYADLDGLASNVHDQYGSPMAPQRSRNESFDLLLNEMKATLCKRSSV